MHEAIAAPVLQGLSHVFVYGTLRRGEANDINRLWPVPRWKGLAQVRGFLWALGAYPGLQLHEDAPAVVGEVYRVDAALWPVLHAIEGIGAGGFGASGMEDEYQLRVVMVHVAGQNFRCGVYEIHPDRRAGATQLRHGDWRLRSGAVNGEVIL